VVRVQLKISRDMILNCAFHRVHVFAFGDAGAVTHPKDMRVHGLRGLLPPHVQYDVCGLAAHTGQRLQGRA